MIYVVAVEANRCARGVVKGNERERDKWNLIKRGACLSRLAVGLTAERSRETAASSERGQQQPPPLRGN